MRSALHQGTLLFVCMDETDNTTTVCTSLSAPHSHLEPLTPQGFGSLSTASPPSSRAMNPEPSERPPADERLSGVRRHMAAADGNAGVHALIVPTEDPHMSEYSPSCFTRRQFVSRSDRGLWEGYDGG